MHTIYIVPALTDQAGQCRIVAANGSFESPRDSYKSHPELWKEIGIMNSAGKIVCLQASPETTDTMKDCEPLIAGSYFMFDI